MKNNFLFILLLTLCSPAISFGAEYHTMEIDFSFTADPARNLLGYRLFEEGVQVCETTDPSVSKISCDVLTEDGTFNFTLAAYYSDGTESPPSPSFPFTIVSTTSPDLSMPQVVITPSLATGTLATVTVPLTVSFSVANSSNDIASYSWDFGDGFKASGITTSHTFTTPGIYTVKLIVTDNSGSTSVSSQTVSVLTADEYRKKVMARQVSVIVSNFLMFKDRN